MKNTPKQSKKQPSKSRPVYTYNDILKLNQKSPYSAFGQMIPSTKLTQPRAIFGTAERKNQEKVIVQKQLMKKYYNGKQGIGPAGYLPSCYVNEGGEEIARPDIQSNLRFNGIPSYSVGKQPRKNQQWIPNYNYMNTKYDNIDINYSDLKRRNSVPSIRIGTQCRFKEGRKDKITPGPDYNPKFISNKLQQPIYSFGVRRNIAGFDPLVSCGRYCLIVAGTTEDVGPNTYFQKGNKSKSTPSLSRVPQGSNMKKQPVVSFAKGPKTLNYIKNTVDDTYDIKNKAILAHYDFQYDGGKGLNSGRAWQKSYITKCSQNPLERIKMKSFTMGRSSREKEQKRGGFKSLMSQNPTPVRIQHPKF